MFRPGRRSVVQTRSNFDVGAVALWCSGHSPWVRIAHRCCTLIALCPSAALAADDATAQPRDGFSFDLRLAAGGATAAFTESERAVADFEALAVGAGARFGWFVGPHVLIGAELSSSWHSGVGALRVQDAFYFLDDGVPGEASYTVVVPLGVFIELYPWVDSGWFFAVAGGVGFIDLPSFSDGDSNVLTSGFSLDAGYELSQTAKTGPALFARYSRWAGEEFFSSEHPDGLVSRELLVGLRWSFWTPEWQ